jgi:hypothetical protein
MVAGTLDVAAPQLVGVVGTSLDFGLDAKGDLEGKGGDRGQYELADGVVDARAGDAHAYGRARVDTPVLAHVHRGPVKSAMLRQLHHSTWSAIKVL